MKLSAISLLLCTLNSSTAISSNVTPPPKKGSLYFYWGYNRSFYSKTNLHFSGPDYDFSLYDLKGADRPSPFGSVYFNPSSISIPQYNYRIGYMLTNRLAISGGMDHMKYVVTQDQQTTISGVITKEASDKYAGYYLNEPIQLKADLLKFEHTNGFNFVSLDFEYQQPLFRILKDNIRFLLNSGIGGVWMVTKTDVRVMDDGLDNDFHVAGYAMSFKIGPRTEFKNHLFIAAELKGGYATLPSVLIKNDAPEVGNHNLGFLEYYIVVGTNFRLKKTKTK
jgi:hypothetical protein